MAIDDVTTVGSPGWWMQRLSRQMVLNRSRMDILESYWNGTPKLIYGNQIAQSAFESFQRSSVTNFASLIASAPVNQIELRSVMTAVENDVEGDVTAWKMVTASGFDLALLDAGLMAKKFGWSYLAVAPSAEPDGFPIITAEDPRTMVHECLPTDSTQLRAAFKLYYDSEASLDVAVLWLPS